jgi:hypothetical protein
MLRIHVAIATAGRAALLCETVELLAQQTRQPDGVLIVAPDVRDVAGVGQGGIRPEIALSARGLCRQRNHALDLLHKRADVVLFLDDDFVAAPDYIAQLERLFDEHTDVVGATGLLIADGVRKGGYSLADALALIEREAPTMDTGISERLSLYGCNMALRLSHAEGLRFDEALPLYGWQEDVDFTTQLARRGRLICSGLITGVHLGTKSGRSPGRRLGYSQIANILYLKRKGTLPPRLGERLLMQNIIANILRAPFPEPHIDRLGRLRGNLQAFGDLLRGRLDPRRIEQI